MSRTVQITFDAADPASLGSFWAEALGYTPEPPPAGFDSWPAALAAFGVPEEKFDDAYALLDPDGAQRIFFQRVPEPKTAKNRMHLDLRLSRREGSDGLEAEVKKAEALGAQRGNEYDELGSHWVVMRDVEGNEFCIS